MGRRTYTVALATICALTACGGGGGSASGTISGSVYGVVQLLELSPVDEAVQVPLDAAIELEFDARMALDSFGDEDTWLRAAGSSTNVPGTFALGHGGRVRFTPAT